MLHLSEPFTKTWRIKNSGTCTWTTAYKLVFVGGDKMSAPTSAALPINVAPAQTVDLSISLLAPDAAGHYEGYWQLQSADGQAFGVGATGSDYIWVKIRAIAPAFSTATATPSVTGTALTASSTPNVTPSVETPAAAQVPYDFVGSACTAQWQSNTGILPCPGLSGDTNGFVIPLDQAHLEDGSTSSLPTLLTFPQDSANGYILGLYPPYEVQPGDHFQTTVGCEQNATGCSTLFRVSYLDSTGAPHDLWSLGEFYDGKYFNLDLDLGPLAGQTIQFVLNVGDLGSPTDDRALWVDPRIVRFPVAAPTPTVTPTATLPPSTPTASPTVTPPAAPTTVPTTVPASNPNQPSSIQQILDSIVSFFRQLLGGQ